MFTLIAFIFFLFVPFVIAQESEGGDIELLGLELEKLLYLINGLIALILFVVAFMAYKRDGRKRLLFVSIAFLLLAVKGFLLSSELFIFDIGIIDPIAVILEFLAILSFFFGVLKK